MALARIISRSHECSRELALDLLARGYTVEIVSPDAVPDNLADLELRVDSDSADVLKASVATHDGARSTSLDFVHHLKAPMGNFIRRPPERRESSSVPSEPVQTIPNYNGTDESIVETRVADHRSVAEPAEPVLLFVQRVEVQEVEAQRAEVARAARESVRISDEISVPVLSFQPIQEPEPKIIPVAATVNPTAQPAPRIWNSPPTWIWRSAMGFAGVVLVALALGMGMRKIGAAPIPGALDSGIAQQGAADRDIVAPSVPAINPKTTTGSLAEHSGSLPPVARTGDAVVNASQSQPLTTTPVPRAVRTHPERKRSHARGEEVVAHDTVTYLDKSYARPSAPKKSAHKRAPARKSKRSGEVIAADTVTYLNGKTSKTTSRQ